MNKQMAMKFIRPEISAESFARFVGADVAPINSIVSPASPMTDAGTIINIFHPQFSGPLKTRPPPSRPLGAAPRPADIPSARLNCARARREKKGASIRENFALYVST